MKQLFYFSLLLSFHLSYSQWTVVQKFDRPIRFLEAGELALAVVTDSNFFLISNPEITSPNALPFYVRGNIVGIDSKGIYFYLATATRVYEHLTAPLPIGETTTAFPFSSLHCWKDKKLVTFNNTRGLYAFKYGTSPYDTLDYTSLSNLYPLMTTASDDSMAFIGYSNYGGAFAYQEKDKKWKHVPQLESEVIYDSYTKNGITMFRMSKAGTDFYFSSDYGQTGTVYANVLPFCSQNSTVLTYENGSAFLGYNYNSEKGVYQSDNQGKSWKKILADSAITGLAIYKQALYASTSKGSLLRTPITPLVTSIETEDLTISKAVYLHENVLHNISANEIQYQLCSISGTVLGSALLPAHGQTELRVPAGLYLMYSKGDGNAAPLKIVVK